VCRSSDGGRQVAQECHILHSMPMECLPLLDRLTKRESNRQQLGVDDVPAPSAPNAAAGPPLISLSLSQHCEVLLAAVASYSMVVLTNHSSHGAGQTMPSVFWPWSCLSLTTLHISAPEEQFWCNSCTLLLHVSASLPANRCCLESKITGPGVSPDYLIRAPCGDVGSAPGMGLARRSRRS
jgi:hypothetical protein